jgi:tetratricopeptide (TPR) repeat protein
MFWTILFTALFVLGVAAFIFLLVRKWTQLRLLDVESLSNSETKKKKQELIKQRIERAGLKYAKKAQKDVIKPIGLGLQTLIRTFAGKLTAAERRYQQKKNKIATREGDSRVIDEMISDAQKFMDEEIWDQAEKKLIAIIGLDARNKEAYELLGRVYLYNKDFPSAKETFEFLNKLSPHDASVIASLGEVAQKLASKEDAVKYFKKAVEISPKNPKYLDMYLESVIDIGDVHEAMTALDRLREVNPDNRKIEYFEGRIDQIRSKIKK